MGEDNMLGADEQYCQSCGKIVKIKAEICPSCGVRQRGGYKKYSRISAALFALFLGGFGAHKFYLGQTGKGILYLIFFWTLIPGIIAFVEFIIFLSMSDEAFDAKYNS